MMTKTYFVVDDQISNGNKTLRFAGNKDNPLFLAKDVVIAMGQKYHGNCRNFYKDLPGRTEVDRGDGNGNHMMVAVTKQDVEIALARKPAGSPEYRKAKEEFRKFWNNTVIPQIEYPAAKAKISDLEMELAQVRAELELYKTGKIRPILNETA